MKNSKWLTTSEKEIYRSKQYQVVEQTCSPEKEPAKKVPFLIVRTSPWCNIIAITEDQKIILVNQYRMGSEAMSLEFPGGVMDPEDPSSKDAALRELKEETGYAPTEDAQVIELGWIYPNPAFQNNKAYCVIVGPVRKVSRQDLDPNERVECLELSIEDFLQRVQAGEIRHALMLNTLLFTLFQDKKAYELLAGQMKKFSRPNPSAKS